MLVVKRDSPESTTVTVYANGDYSNMQPFQRHLAARELGRAAAGKNSNIQQVKAEAEKRYNNLYHFAAEKILFRELTRKRAIATVSTASVRKNAPGNLAQHYVNVLDDFEQTLDYELVDHNGIVTNDLFRVKTEAIESLQTDEPYAYQLARELGMTATALQLEFDDTASGTMLSADDDPYHISLGTMVDGAYVPTLTVLNDSYLAERDAATASR
jgi:hypothetical protein